MPVYAAAVTNVPLDGSYLWLSARYVSDCLRTEDIERWIAWKESLICFKQANTDSGIVPLGMRCVLVAERDGVDRSYHRSGRLRPDPSARADTLLTKVANESGKGLTTTPAPSQNLNPDVLMV